MLVIAVDPGLTGACSIVDRNGLRALFDLPVMKIPGVGPKALVQNKVDGKAFRALLRQHCPAGEAPVAVIEAVGTMGGANNAVQTQGSLLRSLGALETVFECCGVPLAYAHPQTWKRHYGLIDPDLKPAGRKKKALECARRLYPQADIGKAKHHNRAESVLIARWFQDTQT